MLMILKTIVLLPLMGVALCIAWSWLAGGSSTEPKKDE